MAKIRDGMNLSKNNALSGLCGIITMLLISDLHDPHAQITRMLMSHYMPNFGKLLCELFYKTI